MVDEIKAKSSNAAGEAFSAARRHFESGVGLPLPARLAALARLETALTTATDELLAALAADLGKPPLEAWLAEIHFAISEIRLFRKKLRRWQRPKRARHPFYLLPARSEIRREPYGVVLIAAPWNYPLQLSLSPLVAAVAAGNSVVLKPSELAPATASALRDHLAKVFPDGQVAALTGGPELGAALLDQPFDFFFYTGSETVGRLYAAAAAEHLAPCVLELGGKCPCLVDQSADLDLVVTRLVSAKWFNAGQTCIAPDFVLVHASRHETLVKKLAEQLRTSYGPSVPRDLARIVNRRHYDRLLDLESGEVIRIGEDDPGQLLLAPRILPQATWDDPAMGEEIFGPILPVIAFDTLDEALARLRRQPAPLALYAFSKDDAVLEHIAAAIPSGSVCFNDAVRQALNLELPFGGTGTSGMGRYRGKAGFETFTWERPVTKRYWIRDFFNLLPPYGDKLKVFRKWMR